MKIYKHPNKKNKIAFYPNVQNLSRVGNSIENYNKKV